ncbi:CoA-binding protein [Rhodoplanes serenus]|uniref:CoA-binding protein n=1 Tax=Rhodoplanes serenus TaxID=200615 RepID=UPI000DAE4DD5|nr:CoA-binding protein [Rhodoplanes serenus]RAI36336.1 CoA-binding protein [Rhodoplanes serenus]
MHKDGIGPFKYFVGISSLDQVASRHDRVCVLNVLGGESKDVTPVGHVYSGGNVVFGTSPGRSGQSLKTSLGDIPVYNDVREGMEAGHRFNCGVIYLPPSGARDGVAELIRVNPELRKIFMVTEKVSVHDAREIRAMGQQNGIDIFGGNSLGVADAWNEVRIGGALGGDAPREALRRGSIAIYSNSGNFTTTMATYLRMAGWGTTTLISSGKDVYIHFAAPEFAYALANDMRSKAAVLYVEPGGHYELEATFTKPVVACVVGRWKSKLTRPVGHAGAMSGGDDDAAAKERWFMEKFEVDGVFTPERPVFSRKGAVVTNIAHITHALTAVMQANACLPDFEPEGNLSLKPWFGSSMGLVLPAELDLPVVEAMPPYGAEIARLNRQIGTVFPRQSMKDASGASQMDPSTQVTTLHGVSVLDAAQHPLEANVALALLRQVGGPNDRALINVMVGASLGLFGTPMLAAAEAARAAGNAPNAVLAAAAAITGPRAFEGTRRLVRLLLEAFSNARLASVLDDGFDVATVAMDEASRALFVTDTEDPIAEALIAGVAARGAKAPFVRWLRTLPGHPTADAVRAAIAASLAWGPLLRKRISPLTAETLPWWLHLFGVLIGASVEADRHAPGAFCGYDEEALLRTASLGEVACTALIGRAADPDAQFAFQTLIGLLLSNGPGTISAQGAKGAVSSDGPEAPDRVQLNKAMLGFLSHCGYAHGGNGFEGIAFLIEQFAPIDLDDPGRRDHGLDLATLAKAFARTYKTYKTEKKQVGSLAFQKIPGVNHPVFKDKPVNKDPREVFVRELYERRGEYNVFHEFYHAVVQALFEAGISRNVYCVNVDALIAAVLLKLMWRPFRTGAFGRDRLETAAFTVFLYARMLGCAAEADDHLNRGRDMDTRTPASKCAFVS